MFRGGFLVCASTSTKVGRQAYLSRKASLPLSIALQCCGASLAYLDLLARFTYRDFLFGKGKVENSVRVGSLYFVN